jgi:NAD(P)-dependent dehydrogenase (short-subunit alcohol dehydrogenase family)
MGNVGKEGVFDLEDKIVVIGGATGLLGREICTGFVQQGSKVVIASRNRERGKALEKTLREKGNGKAVYCRLDIAREKSVDQLIRFVMGRFSGIDVFINCAFPRTKDWMLNVEKVPYKSIRENMSDHLGGYYLCTQKMAMAMKPQKRGSIINFSSIYGMVGPHFAIYKGTKMTCPPAYPLIKGGIVAMTKYFATYFAKDDIRVNCICPGGIFDHQDDRFVARYQQLTPLGRMGKPEDVVSIVLMLASDTSSYITGQSIMDDGGWTTW